MLTTSNESSGAVAPKGWVGRQSVAFVEGTVDASCVGAIIRPESRRSVILRPLIDPTARGVAADRPARYACGARLPAGGINPRGAVDPVDDSSVRALTRPRTCGFPRPAIGRRGLGCSCRTLGGRSPPARRSVLARTARHNRGISRSRTVQRVASATGPRGDRGQASGEGATWTSEVPVQMNGPRQRVETAAGGSPRRPRLVRSPR